MSSTPRASATSAALKAVPVKTVFLILLVIGLCRSCSAETFLVTSDLHLTKDIEKHGAVLAALRHAAEDVDAVLFLGDSTNNAHEEEHANMIDFLDSLPKPAYVIPGNHDITLNLPEFIDRLKAISEIYGLNFVVSLSADKEELIGVNFEGCEILN